VASLWEGSSSILANTSFIPASRSAANRKDVEAQVQKLELLMDKAEKGAGGAVVSVIAYKGEYLAVQDELKVIDATRATKNAKPRTIGAVLPPSGEGPCRFKLGQKARN
jgi:hypothetical protein